MDLRDIRLARLERNFRHLAESAAAHSLVEAERSKRAVERARAIAAAATAREATPPGPSNGRAAVVAWDLAHNPVGRAHVIYRLLESGREVDLIGPLWSRYGEELWQPLRDATLDLRSFRCSTLADFVPKAEALAATRVYDIVHVCKPRLPSLYLGALIAESSECPLVLDVDDSELSFFGDPAPMDADEFERVAAEALLEPYGELATRYARSLIPAADALSVSNTALRAAFGGSIVRHARDEAEFANTPARRRTARERLGIAEDDFALLFVGTPRAHKGVLEVARALEEIADPSIVFHVIGDFDDPSLRRVLEARGGARVVLHPGCALAELPEFLAGADLVPLIQDVDHPVSRFQIPAKVSDALALGVPVLATGTPPLKDLIAAGSIHETDLAGLPDAIRTLKARAVSGDVDARRARRDFVGELGFAVNRARLDAVIAEARAAHAARGPALAEPLGRMVHLMRERYAALRRAGTGGAVGANRSAAIVRGRSRDYDIAFFWKQNDSGLYGRRSDMVARHLAASGRVNRLLHFDAPMSMTTLGRQLAASADGNGEQAELLLGQLCDRQLGVHDDATMRSRTFVGSEDARRGRLFGHPLRRRGSFARFVGEQMEEFGMRPESTLAWVCPVVWDARELVDTVGFGRVVVDLIDDQRAWEGDTGHRTRLEGCYRDTLGMADLVFANCGALAEAMSEFAPTIRVVPNGAERFGELSGTAAPAALRGIAGPIAGYVGNLRDRIDWLLLHRVVTALPEVSFVFFGPANDNPNAVSLAKHPNVHMPGIVPYAELPGCLGAFDVGLVPHLSNRLTERMNPLKVYNYFAAGLPVVSTEVGNLADLGDALRTAGDADGFVRAIRDALAAPLDTGADEWRRTMDTIAWDTRVAEMLAHMDRSLQGRHEVAA